MPWKKTAVIVLVIACLMPFSSPPVALSLGLLAAFTIGNPFHEKTKKIPKFLLQASVVLLGFGMNLTSVVKAGREGILFTLATIFGTLALGYLAGRALGIRPKTTALVSTGTAICGGSAIAAVAPAVNADPEETSVSLATVFILNSVALLVFPAIGHGVGLSEAQFGLWAAVAIHDTSSVVGAATSYGPEALAVATTVKLARALWIAPVALFYGWLFRDRESGSSSKVAIPWFILLFIVAATLRTYAPSVVQPSIFDALVNLAKAGLTLTLFLIGASLSRSVLKSVGIRPFLLGLLLWIAISVSSLAMIWKTV